MAMGKYPRAHVALVPSFVPGHVVPFFDLAIRMAASGDVKVTILLIAHVEPQVWVDPLYARWAPRLRSAHPNIELVPVDDGMYDGTLGWYMMCIKESSEDKFIAAFAGHFKALFDSSLPPCCIISDMVVGWTQRLAAQFGIPRYLMHIQAASNLSLMLHAPTLVAQGRLPLTEDNIEEPIVIPGGFVVQPADLPTDLNSPVALARGSDQFWLSMARRARESPIVLVNSFRELEENVMAALDDLHSQAPPQNQAMFPKVIPIGPLQLPSDFPLPDGTMIEEDQDLSEESVSLLQWLDMQPPRFVLYVAFGTLVNNAREETEEIAHALEGSGQTFLWSAGTLLSARNMPSPPTLAEVLPPGFEERTRERGKIATFAVPQLRILRHPACGAILNHCGWNTVLESLSGGVPLITWPRKFEQRMTTRYLVDVAKVAAELVSNSGTMGRGEIERMVRLVMQQEEGKMLRHRAGELKECIASRYAHSNPNFDNFLTGLIKLQSSYKLDSSTSSNTSSEGILSNGKAGTNGIWRGPALLAGSAQ